VALAARKASNHSSAGIAIERIYVFESLGSLAAGLVLTCVLIPFTSSYAGYCLLLLVAVVLWLPAASRKFIVGYRWLVFEALALAILCAPPVAQRVEAKLQQLRFESLLPHARLLDWDETPYTHLALSQGATHALFSGGSYVLDFPDSYEDEARAHPLMLLAQRPRRILIVGSFEPGMLRYWLEHPVERIDWVSLDERAHTFVLKYLDTTARSAFSAPRMHCRFEDPRTWLQHSSAQFDLILQLEREPATLMLARNSTLEFLHLLGTHLAPGGTLVTRVASGPNVQVGPRALLGASIYSTIGRVLPFVRAVPDPLNVLISGTTSEAVSLEHATIIRRWKERAIPSEIVTPETLVDLFPPERIATLNRELAAAARTATPNTDDRPAAFVHAFALRQQIAGGPGLLALTDFLERPKLVWALVLLPSLLLLGATKFLTPQRRALAAVVHTVTIVGATGMALDLLVLFSFQTYVGALYS
jgi:spermidine synthase